MSEISHKEANKLIAQNTFFLYLRTLIGIIINLFSVRVIWQALGVEDYGIYNVVAGIVLMFQFLNTAMVGASQRYLSYSIGKNDKQKIIETFSTSVRVHLLLAIVIFVLAETVGLWIIETQIKLPPDRVLAGHWVYQASIISLILMVISVPYNASIVAYEDMKIYGIYGILEIILKFGVALILFWCAADKLIIYSSLLLVISALMLGLYVRFSRKHYPDLRYHKPDDNSLLKKMFGFAGWTLIGSFAVSAREQGLNILLNMFYSFAYNAAKGIANQVSGVVMGFTGNFQMSLFPQITKRYATGDITSMMSLIFSGCQLSYYLLLIILVPLYFRTENVLQLWLQEGVSVEMVIYLRIILIALLIDCMKGPLIAALQATGNVRDFQLMVFVVLIAALPIAYIWMKVDSTPYAVVYSVLITNALALIGRFWLMKRQIGLGDNGVKDVWELLGRLTFSTAIFAVIAWYINPWFSESIFGLAAYSITTLVINLAGIFLFGLTKAGKELITSMFGDYFAKLTSRFRINS